MDEGKPIDMTALRRKALDAQAELVALAELYTVAIRTRQDPASASLDEVKRLAEGILRHVKPFIEK